MNRFGSGYDDLFAAFGVGGRDEHGPDAESTDEPSGATPPPAAGDVRPVEDAEGLANFLAKAMKAVEGMEGSGNGRLGEASGGPGGRGQPLAAPVDVVERAEGLLITFDLPGVAESDVELAAAPRAIRLRASRRLPLPPGASALRRERSAGRIERIVPVPPGFDSGSLEARLNAGVLAVMVPRHEASERDSWEQQGGSGLWNEG